VVQTGLIPSLLTQILKYQQQNAYPKIFSSSLSAIIFLYPPSFPLRLGLPAGKCLFGVQPSDFGKVQSSREFSKVFTRGFYILIRKLVP
jgi:hypothetical protein